MPESKPGTWTFLTNHGHVLLCLAMRPGARVRDVAAQVGITERAVLRILAELEEAGYLVREHAGRRTTYRLRLDQPMRHRLEAQHPVRSLVEALGTSR
jgi:DNA-binding MarR family transcriptional regulator